MLTIIVRAIQSALAVVAGIATAARLGDGNLAKLAAVPVAAAAAILIEYGLIVAPRRSRWIRRRLDPRAVFEGVWLQNVKSVFTRDTGPRSNRFAVFTVTGSGGTYAVEGTAYDAAGEEHARWHATKPLHFSADGRSMVYLWEGSVMAKVDGASDLDRTGFADLQLTSDGSGTGRVDHVAQQVTLIFNVQRVTPEIVGSWKPGAEPDLLRNLEERDRFAKHFARGLAAPP